MRDAEVLIVRVYLSDDPSQHETVLERLRTWGRARGATVFAATGGFGPGGESLRGSTVVEFFDQPERARRLIELLEPSVGSEHIVYWPASMRVAE